MRFNFKRTIAGLLVLGLAGVVWAMPPQEAKTRVQQHATDKGLTASDVSRAVTTLEQLIARGVPVEHAHAVVKAAIDEGIRGTDLADIARGMEREKRPEVSASQAADRAFERVRARHRARKRQNDTATPPRQAQPRPARPGRDYGGRPGGMPGGGRPGR